MGYGPMTGGRRRTGPRRVCVVTGSRAEYGLLKSTMAAISKHPRLRLQLVVTGMHLLRKFGHTADEIVRDGWTVDARIRMQRGGDGESDQAEGLAAGIAGIARFCVSAGTDVVLVLGDRIEAMAGALAGVTTGRLVAHIHGGDVAPGDFDEPLRNAITKLSHLHLVATRAAGRRIIRMGEEPQRVHFVGAPGLDRLMEILKGRGSVKTRSGHALVVQHAYGRSPAREKRTMNAVLRVVEEAGLNRTIVYPNSDRGHSGVISAIEQHCRAKSNGCVRVVRTLERDSYLRLLMEADVLVGNSSSGIIEAGPAGTAAVNVGDRQRGRERNGSSIIDAAESISSIRSSLGRALRKRPITGRSTVYGDGQAGRRIAALLAGIPLDERFRRKQSPALRLSGRT